jgi:hypothetical protein
VYMVEHLDAAWVRAGVVVVACGGHDLRWQLLSGLRSSCKNSASHLSSPERETPWSNGDYE